MSAVYVYAVDKRGDLSGVDDARNANRFHIAIWDFLGTKHGYWTRDSWRWFNDRSASSPLERLWADIGKLPRIERIAMAATFDRCWFPWSMRDELIASMRAIAPFATTAGTVADIITGMSKSRGIAFGSSLANAWNCTDDEMHPVNDARCRRCGKDVSNAIDVVGEP